MTYEIINSAGIVLGSFELSFVSEAAIAGGVISTLSLPNGTTLQVGPLGDGWVAWWGDQRVTVEEA